MIIFFIDHLQTYTSTAAKKRENSPTDVKVVELTLNPKPSPGHSSSARYQQICHQTQQFKQSYQLRIDIKLCTLIPRGVPLCPFASSAA
jgi:hypothetical protein